jgi:RimJ/RimL family protein N-acetyltransferase
MLSDPVETQRLRVRPFSRGDWPDVHAYTSDAGVMTYVEEGCMTEEQTRQFVDENLGDDARVYAVELLAENRLIGHVNFYPWYGPRTYEIGWVFHPRYHGRGYATEAAAALLRYGFETLRLHRIIATCQPENTPSWRVMEKLGMRREAHFRKGHLRGATWWDEYFYALLAEEWPAASSASVNASLSR